MAAQIVISNKDYISIDDVRLVWADKGNSMPALPDTIHYVIWRSSGVNEIQNKDSSTNIMTENTDLNSASDAVGDTTIQALLDWGTTRCQQIEIAGLQESEAKLTASDAHADGGGTLETFVWDKTWKDYDPNYS